MANADIQLLKKLRNETLASIADCRVALEETDNNYEKAAEWIKKNALSKADKKQDRDTSQGIVDSYIHGGGRVGVLIELLCETDFVVKTEEFKSLSHEICMQIASMSPETVEELEKQEYIRDSSLTIQMLVKSVVGKLGENIKIKRFQRFELGE